MLIFQFQRPAVLWALLMLPLAGALWWHAAGAARLTAARLGDERRAEVNRLSGVLRLAALALLILGTAGPLAPTGTAPIGAGAPLVFVLDSSPSMAAEDVMPSRFAGALEAVEHIAALLPQAPVGLVGAAYDPQVLCPPTEDRGVFRAVLGGLKAGRAGPPGTRLRQALREAGHLLEGVWGAGAVILVSDGEDHGEPPEQMIEQMKRRGMVLHTVTVGAVEGARIRPPYADPAGVVRSRADPQKMARWASAGGGAAWRIGGSAERLPSRREQVVGPTLARLVGLRSGAFRPLAPWLYCGAALLLAGDLLRRLW